MYSMALYDPNFRLLEPVCTPWTSVCINVGHSSLGTSIAAIDAMKLAAWLEVWWSAAASVIKAYIKIRPSIIQTSKLHSFLLCLWFLDLMQSILPDTRPDVFVPVHFNFVVAVGW
jgi:hypothetical protein